MTARVKTCQICKKPRLVHCRYCPRCNRLIGSHDMAAHAAALKAAWSMEQDGFLCFLTGVKLEEIDIYDPFFLTYDHYLPKRKGTLVVCASFANEMKTSLSGDEFWCIVMEYDSFRKGAPFHKDVVDFLYWNMIAKPEPRPLAGRLPPGKAGSRRCPICNHETTGYRRYCARCQRKNPNLPGRAGAMKDSWCEEMQRFLDHYIGVELEENDLNDPYYMVFDHRIPGKKGDLVATSMLMNAMKGDLSDEEFDLMMAELARSREGKPFNRDVIKFEYRNRG